MTGPIGNLNAITTFMFQGGSSPIDGSASNLMGTVAAGINNPKSLLGGVVGNLGGRGNPLGDVAQMGLSMFSGGGVPDLGGVASSVLGGSSPLMGAVTDLLSGKLDFKKGLQLAATALFPGGGAVMQLAGPIIGKLFG